jgi:secreted Zn-dependent insulinase-like peptidase
MLLTLLCDASVPLPYCCCTTAAVLQEFDPDCIRSFLDQLNPSRARVTWASRVHEQQQQQQIEASGPLTDPSAALPPPQLCAEPIYGTQYDVQPLPKSWLESWSNGVQIQGLHLPEVNPFVPDDLALTAVGGPKEGLPVVLLEDGGVRLWQRTDLRFKNPKATIVLDFQVGREGALWCVLWCVLLMMSNGVCCSNR